MNVFCSFSGQITRERWYSRAWLPKLHWSCCFNPILAFVGYKYHICWSSNPVSNPPMHCRVSAAMARRCSTSQPRCGSIKVNTRKWSNIKIPSDQHIKYIWVDDKRPHSSTEMMRSVYRDNYSKMDLFQVTGPFLLGGALAKRRSVAENFRSVFIYFYLPSKLWPWINTYKYHIFRGWTSIYQLFWCSPGIQGFDPSPYKGI